MTATTLPMAALACTLMLMQPRWILTSLLAMLALQDAAMLNMGGSPIYVGWCFVLLAALRCSIVLYPIPQFALLRSVVCVTPLLIVYFYGLLATIYGFVVFYDKFLTMPGSAKFL